MRRSLSKYATGERIPHPDAEPELYDLLTLASGPWSEARFRVSPTIVVRARHWLTYVDSLKGTATLDVDSVADRISDERKALSAKTPGAREALARSQINRAAKHLAEAKQARRQAREALLLDEDD